MGGSYEGVYGKWANHHRSLCATCEQLVADYSTLTTPRGWEIWTHPAPVDPLIAHLLTLAYLFWNVATPVYPSASYDIPLLHLTTT